ncbi:MAG TPA: DNA-formamidopyrimidine glycosylase family protein, partial [Acidimicrobiales bacterium]|nr:DNA-formamidopyrimidine glycosylase family protein [Acidimicrobiales bacterium]
MPELPEVEALVRFLDERSRGSEVELCQLASISALKSVDPPLETLRGCRVEGWHRRGKFLQMHTAAPRRPKATATFDPEPVWLVLNLARGGWISWWEQPPRGAVRLGGRGPLALRVSLRD